MFTSIRAIRSVFIGLALGIGATILTFQRGIGLGFTLFGLALVVSTLGFARLHQIRPLRRNLITLIPVLFFTGMLSIRSDTPLILMNSGAALIALLLLASFFRGGGLLNLSLLEYPARVILGGITVVVQPASEFKDSAHWLAKRRVGWLSLKPILRGGLITVPVVAVFVVLLSSADEVFAQLVRDLFQPFTFHNLGHLTEQAVYTAIFMWGAIGFLSVAMMERKIKRTEESSASESVGTDDDLLPSGRVLRLSFTEAVMLLGSVSAVFAAFVLIQFVYLFGGAKNLVSFSYADYVHRGFTELIVVAVLTLGLALTLNWLTIRKTARQINIMRGLSTILLILTGVILLSAFQRLRLYEMTYGFTALRLLIYVFIGWLGFTFVGFTTSLYWSPSIINVFSATALIAVFGFAATIDLLNPDYFVAMQNINRGDVDPLHFSLLSEEAAPALVALIDAPEPGLRRIVRYTLATYRLALLSPDADWRDFNLDRQQITAILQSVQDRLTGPESDPSWTHNMDEFSALRRGMTVREVARKLGFAQSGTEPYGEFSRQSNSLLLVYETVNGGTVELRFDSALGLVAMDHCSANQDACTPMPFAA